jgi:hypothetical protein
VIFFIGKPRGGSSCREAEPTQGFSNLTLTLRAAVQVVKKWQAAALVDHAKGVV